MTHDLLDYSYRGRRSENSARILRVDSRKSYIANNVWVVTKRAEELLGSTTLDELKLLVAAKETLAQCL